MASDEDFERLKAKVLAFHKAGQEVRNAAAVGVVDKNLRLTKEQSQQLQELCLAGQVDGAKAEWFILELDIERSRIGKLLGES